MNRIQTMIDKVSVAMQGIGPAELAAQSRKLDMTFEEHSLFQERKSLAFANGSFTLEEATLLYNLLGGTVSVFNRQPVPVKLVLTRVLVMLLGS